MLSKAEAAFVVNHQVGKQSLPHVALESHTPAASVSRSWAKEVTTSAVVFTLPWKSLIRQDAMRREHSDKDV